MRMADIEEMAALAEQLRTSTASCRWGCPKTRRWPSTTFGRGRDARRHAQAAHGSYANGGVVRAVKDMCTAAGASDSFMIYAMPAPPLMHDRDGLTELAACAEHEVPIIWAAAPNAGSTGPRSIAGTAVVGNAETLAGLVYRQQIRPGAPFVFGVGTGAMDMRTAVDACAPPESPLGQAAQEDLCRWYGLPSFNYAAMSDSKTLDEQFALEYGLTAMAGALPRGALIHDVGYVESGAAELVRIDRLRQRRHRLGQGLHGRRAHHRRGARRRRITAVGPGGNFLARKSTRAHSRDFWYDDLSTTPSTTAGTPSGA